MLALTATILAVDSAVDPTGGLLSYGVLGIVVVCLITGLLVPAISTSAPRRRTIDSAS